SFRSRPYLDRVQFRFYPSYQIALKAYENDEIQGISRIPLSELSQARSFEELNLFSAQLTQFGVVLMNQARDDLVFFQEPEVRQAMLYGLDRQGIIDEAFDGYALVPHSPIVAGTWAYKEDVLQYGYDPDKAAEILDEAGWVRQAVGERYRRKEGVWLTFELLTSSDPERASVAQMMAEQWATLGISVTVETGTSLEVRRALETREFDAVLVELAIPGDPDPYPFWHEAQVDSGQNYSGLEHRRISEVLEQARIVTSRDTRSLLYDEFQDIFAQEVPALLMYVPVYTYGVDNRIHGVQIGPLTYPADRFRTLLNWWIVPRRVFVSESEVSFP
ncbi:MAG: ABC transporter substrate-binding protein, partial [Anaerolineae bacterium]|nr:ABC transporter substrate-binding protein [Anaerolineae bacterium]